MYNMHIFIHIYLFINLYFFSAEGKSKMATILDQKNYLEELNRHLK